MKTLKKSVVKCTENKILQGLLCIHGFSVIIDSSFGKATLAAVKQFQKAHSLVTDGVVGPATQRALGILPAANSKILTIRIPFSAITNSQVYSKNCTKLTVPLLAKQAGCNFAFNAGMFDMKSYVLLNDVLDNGQPIIHTNGNAIGGNYSQKGLSFDCTVDSKIPIKFTTLEKCKNKSVDFLGGNEILIESGKKVMELSGSLTKSFISQSTWWTACGCDDKAFYYMTNLSKCSLNAFGVEGLAQNIKYLVSYDGGGSRSLALNSTGILTTTRPIPQIIGLKVKAF